MPIRSENLFKVTVFLLAVPATLFLALAILFELITLVIYPGGGIGSFAFGVTRRELIVVAVAGLGTIIFLVAIVGTLFRRHKRQEVSANR